MCQYCCHAGFNVETITYKGMKFTTWDVSGKSGAVSSLKGGAVFLTTSIL